MNFGFNLARRGFLAAATLAVGALIAGCSGGSNSATPSVPQTNTGSAAGGERELARVTVNPAIHVVATDLRVHAMGAFGHFIPNQRMYAAGPSTYSCPTDSQCLQNHGGPTLKNVGSIHVFVNPSQTGSTFPNMCTVSNCPPAQWGFPGGAIGRFDGSTLSTEMHQYVGTSSATHQFPYVGYITMTDSTITADDTVLHAVTPAKITAELKAASGAIGLTGYHYMYQLFYVKDQWLCNDPTHCYAPGGGSKFVFCAYHGSQTVSTNHIIFSVEPWQMVSGCEAPTNTIQNDTASTLSHEWYEAITDPDLSAWYRNSDGQEIGDICRNSYGDIILNPDAIDYNIQQEWNNATEGCDFGP